MPIVDPVSGKKPEEKKAFWYGLVSAKLLQDAEHVRIDLGLSKAEALEEMLKLFIAKKARKK